MLSNPRLAIFTATASKTTKRKIFELLHVNVFSTAVFEKSPSKENIRYAVKYVSNDLSLTTIFQGLINEIKARKLSTEKTLIFCRTRKQCILLFRTFSLGLGENIYNGTKNPKHRMVEMFHAGTPESVKHHVLSSLTSAEGHIVVLICTVAFGMGIDCKNVTRIVHFGGSKSIESYLQECGRAGRSGAQSTCFLLHNGVLMKHSDADMKNYVVSTTCR